MDSIPSGSKYRVCNVMEMDKKKTSLFLFQKTRYRKMMNRKLDQGIHAFVSKDAAHIRSLTSCSCSLSRPFILLKVMEEKRGRERLNMQVVHTQKLFKILSWTRE